MMGKKKMAGGGMMNVSPRKAMAMGMTNGQVGTIKTSQYLEQKPINEYSEVNMMGKKKQVGMMMKRGGKLELKGGGKVMKGKKKKVMKKKKGKKRG